jgi:hypothetical protein
MSHFFGGNDIFGVILVAEGFWHVILAIFGGPLL